MKFVRVATDGGPRWGRLEGEDILLLSASPILGGKDTGEKLFLREVHLLAPVEPSKILGIGLNYRAHALEMGKPLPEEPLLFMKPPSALLEPGGTIVRPKGYQRTDFEGELGVVLGKRARHVTDKDALNYVFGYTIVNDVTVRDLQKKDVQYTRAKGFDSFCPVGPVLATDLDPRALPIRTRQNGAIRQQSSTADLIFPVAQIIAFVSSVMTLEPGDLITTGTPPGVGPIAPGDTIEIEIDGIGLLRSRVEE